MNKMERVEITPLMLSKVIDKFLKFFERMQITSCKSLEKMVDKTFREDEQERVEIKRELSRPPGYNFETDWTPFDGGYETKIIIKYFKEEREFIGMDFFPDTNHSILRVNCDRCLLGWNYASMVMGRIYNVHSYKEVKASDVPTVLEKLKDLKETLRYSPSLRDTEREMFGDRDERTQNN